MNSSLEDIDEGLVTSWIKRRLLYYFMPSLHKYWNLKRVPLKLSIQLIKIICVTSQLVFFGSILAHYIHYGANSHASFEHLYLKNWESSYETIPYPPNSGPFSYYTNEQMISAISFTLDRFNKTEEISVGGYVMSKTRGRNVEICLRHLDKDPNSRNGFDYLKTKCIHLNLDSCTEDEISQDRVIKFLKNKGIVFDPANFEEMTIDFSIDSSVLLNIFGLLNLECYTFNVKVDLDNSYTTSRVLASIHSEYFPLPCDSSNQLEEKKIGGILGLLGSNPNLLRRNVSLAIDIISSLLSLVSFFLCVRSLFRGFKLYIVTRAYLKRFKDKNLKNCCFDFISKWYVLILLGDLFIIIGSIVKMNIESEINNKFKLCSYFLGIGTMLVWFSILKYIDFSYKNAILLRSLYKALPAMLRFMMCSIIIFIAFSLCGWLILGPYHIKFQSYMETLECLFSLLNGDDMYVTFSIIDAKASSSDIVFFSRVFLYTFIFMFIYVVLNLFLAIIIESYETIKQGNEKVFINPMILELIDANPVEFKTKKGCPPDSIMIRLILGYEFSYLDYLPWRKRRSHINESNTESTIDLFSEES